MSEQPRVKIVCPECGGPLPLEAAHAAVKCPRCGHASAPAPRPGTAGGVSGASFPCPRCGVSLFEGNAHGARLHGCGACGGIFLDNDGSTRITRAPDQVIANLARRASMNAARRTIDVERHDLPCPSCREPMRRVVSRGVVELDICPAHGTWFDAGEVNRVMDAYAPQVDHAAAEARSRAAAEARMAQFREMQIGAIDRAESTSAMGALGVTAALLGILGALAGAKS